MLLAPEKLCTWHSELEMAVTLVGLGVIVGIVAGAGKQGRLKTVD